MLTSAPGQAERQTATRATFAEIVLLGEPSACPTAGNATADGYPIGSLEACGSDDLGKRGGGLRGAGRSVLQVVRTGSEVCVKARARNPWQSISVAPPAAGPCFWADAAARVVIELILCTLRGRYRLSHKPAQLYESCTSWPILTMSHVTDVTSAPPRHNTSSQMP